MPKRLLLHVCCGPCAIGTHGYWLRTGLEIVGFFHNPNIQPYLEFRRRLTGVREMAGRTGMALVEDLSYDPESWFTDVRAGGRSRCVECVAMRLDRAARQAATCGCEAFSTTLSISPRQDHAAIESAGVEAGARHGVEFLYQDLRRLYPESRRLSKNWGLYRQQYCGCLVSEWERHRVD